MYVKQLHIISEGSAWEHEGKCDYREGLKAPPAGYAAAPTFHTLLRFQHITFVNGKAGGTRTIIYKLTMNNI